MHPVRSITSALIAEDNALLSITLEDALGQIGAARIEICDNVAHASQIAEGGEIDCAVLDLYLNGESTHGVADILTQRGIPFIFCSGASPNDIEERHRDRPFLAKPYSDADLMACLGSAMAGQRALYAPA